MRLILACFTLFLATFAYAKHAVIIDTDVGPDDIMAINYLLQQPDISVKAITVVGDGLAHCPDALKSITGLLHLLHQSSIPIACDSEKPLKVNNHFPAPTRKLCDDFWRTTHLPHTTISTHQLAVPLFIDTIKRSSEPVDILAIGPLTNLAKAFSQDPSIKKNIARIFIMGGAVNVPGNLADGDPHLKNNTQAEWNIYLDPDAAKIVMQQGIPITLTALDVCNQNPIEMRFVQQLAQQPLNAGGKLIRIILQNNIQRVRAHLWYFWDPLTAVVLSHSEIATVKKMLLNVSLKTDNTQGSLYLDAQHGYPIDVVQSINQHMFNDYLHRSLVRQTASS